VPTTDTVYSWRSEQDAPPRLETGKKGNTKEGTKHRHTFGNLCATLVRENVENLTDGSKDIIGKDGAIEYVAVPVLPLVLGNVRDEIILVLRAAGGKRDLFDVVIRDNLVRCKI
jgi:hypothetical protein